MSTERDGGGGAHGSSHRRNSSRGGATRQNPRDRNAPQAASPRLVAYQVLAEVRDADAYANLVLPHRLRDSGLSAADRALTTELVYGTLRMQGYYDQIIQIAAGRSVDNIDPVALVILRLGAHQLLGMRIPSHAAVFETVSLQKIVGRESAVGFVNGVLRALGRRSPEEWLAEVRESAGSEDAVLAAVYSHPEWIVRAFRASLRVEGRAGELEQLLAADNEAPRVTLARLPGGPHSEELPDRAYEGDVSPLSAVLDGGDPGEITARSNGWIRVQDQGSQLAALIVSRVRPIKEGEVWLDLCAGPGGKSAVLGAEARLGGARVVANEVVPSRADLVWRSVAAVRDTVEVVSGDGRDITEAYPEGFDRILLDAPCTGLGALRRRPEARWRKQPGDVPELTRLQEELMEAAIAALRPGGILAYVTCSPHRAETRMVVSTALRKHSDLREISAREVASQIAPHPLQTAGDDLSLQLWPHRNETDAMFVALLVRDGV
ncbi:transcription antitermination factor NusB [Klugiella xanthotipulae]|uniref:16S rRNA (Cytosine967-C5)-methyltransferase n=1 Tax=Klugiella xanthotipulae TaxID=244735 RepID=A0A543HSI8_9MICO|nr:transcription antitermination factor NusB [Klugiella xanthotipulae]TQM61306.1 16S rRNA (cytosine967-C5)-methyltransferase [Klugiella xanthotipulae]